jgi:hypothetical protein
MEPDGLEDLYRPSTADVRLLRAFKVDLMRKGVSYAGLAAQLTPGQCQPTWEHGPAHLFLVAEKLRFFAFLQDVKDGGVDEADVAEQRSLRLGELQDAHAAFGREVEERERSARAQADAVAAVLLRMAPADGSRFIRGDSLVGADGEFWAGVHSRLQALPDAPGLAALRERNPRALGAWFWRQVRKIESLQKLEALRCAILAGRHKDCLPHTTPQLRASVLLFAG